MRASAITTVLLYGAAAWAATSKDSNDDEKNEETPSKTKDDKASETSSESGTTHTIAVGASGHKFTPGEVEAKVGDTIEWRFYPVEHWVIRGDYDYPCVPYDYIGTDRKSFDSGAQTVQAITNDGPRYRIRVNDTDPIYFYCGAPGSCQRYHMMGIINPWKNQTLEDWQDLAKDVDYQLRPGDPWPSEAAIPSDAPKGKADQEGGDSDSSNDKDGENGEGGGDGGLSGGAIAGIVVGSVAAVALIALVALLCFRRRGLTITRKNENRQSTANTVHSRPGHMSEATYSSVPSGAWTAQTSPFSQHQQTFHQGGHPQAGYQQSPYQPTGSVSPPPVQGGELMSPNMPYPGPTSPYQEQYGTGYYTPQTQTKPEVVPPAELPTSNDPGNSPIPPYRESNRFSWTGPETEYRPSKQGGTEQ